MMSRRKTLPSFSSSRQMMMAWKVSGLSHSPAIIASRPASMRLAMAISPSRESSSTEPISRRYMRTGSSVRSRGHLGSALVGDLLRDLDQLAALALLVLGLLLLAVLAGLVLVDTLMPISLSIARMSSICSEVTSSDGITALSCSCVT